MTHGEESSHRDRGTSSQSTTAGPIDDLKRMFVDIVQARRIRLGQSPAQRPVFLKPHGIAHGLFTVRHDLPDDLKIGVFAGQAFPSWVRFSSDAQPTDPDLNTTCGIGIKLFGVPGDKLLGNGDTQDFILQNYDVFFVDTAQDMDEFTQAGVIGGDYAPYLDTHPVTKRILQEMKIPEASVLTAAYWSVLPYAFGSDRYVKYKLVPETAADSLPSDDPDYLALDLQRRLRAGEARFQFMVQFRTDPATMPLDRATVRWEESESSPVHVADLVLPRQDVSTLGQANYGENLAFNPWHSLPDHAPQGSISDARRVVYAASAALRHEANGISLEEPSTPRAPTPVPEVPDRTIVRAAIYPPIGIARVGNSPDVFFLGPEVNQPLAERPGFYRDASGALKREAARFRIYGLNMEGQAVAELTASNATIEWSVHLANKKAAWYEFQLALDIPEAADAIPSLLRNAEVSDRAALTIDPGARQISGRDVHDGPEHTFDTGAFMGKPVYLGELRTDSEGRLIVLGGHGRSASANGARAVTFANNDGWHDDVADGSVTARVTFNGQTFEAQPAWVIVAPPNYAPQQKSVRTMWDLLRDVAIGAGTLAAPQRPSFTHDILPIFERLSHLQWVNAGYASAFGWRGPNNLVTPDWLARLSQSDPNDREMRWTIVNRFRVLDRDAWAPEPYPWLYGDAMNIPPAQTPRQHVGLTQTQLTLLCQWASGDFDTDFDSNRQPPRQLDDVPIAEQPDMLTRAALEFCLADAFHPGCEMTWPMRSPTMYMAPFRIAHAALAYADPGWIEPNYGEELGQDVITLPEGPLAAQMPGDITRWMAVPWQTDTASCRSGYVPTYDPYLPTFWPARVPNQILTAEHYDVVMDASRPMEERQAAFANRAAWIRPLGSKSYTDQINNMIERYGEMGVVEHRPGPTDGTFPSSMEVENLPEHTHRRLAESGESPHAADRIDLTGIDKVRRFPHGLRRF